MARRKTTEEFIVDSKKKFGDIFDYSKTEYKNAWEPVIITCKKHGDFFVTPHQHLRKVDKIHGITGGCPKCFEEKNKNGNGRRLSQKEFIEKAREVHGNKYDLSKSNFVNTRSKVTIICPKHGEFRPIANNFLRGSTCPFCQESKMEEDIAKFLSENNIVFEREKTFPWLKNHINLRIDFYVEKQKIAIECHGKQHFVENEFFTHDDFEKRKENDEIKKRLCEENGIRVLYFSDEKSIILPDNIITNKKILLNNIIKYGKEIDKE